jgi:hypothetical protein
MTAGLRARSANIRVINRRARRLDRCPVCYTDPVMDEQQEEEGEGT